MSFFAKQRKIYNYAANQEIIPIRLGFVKSFLVKGDSNLILVDTGIPGSGMKIINKIKRLGFNPGQLSLIIITHAHSDHSGSVKELKKVTGAKVAVHKDDASYLMKGESAEITPVSNIGRLLSGIIKGRKTGFEGVMPDIIIENELGLNSFGIKGKVISTPGHTSGSVSILLNSGKCIIGDILMSFGKLNYSCFSNDMAMLKDSLEKILDANTKEIYLSHGGVYGIDEIKNKIKLT
jgi:Zn-dependent hydrolases, including glyoxylases